MTMKQSKLCEPFYWGGEKDPLDFFHVCNDSVPGEAIARMLLEEQIAHKYSAKCFTTNVRISDTL